MLKTIRVPTEVRVRAPRSGHLRIPFLQHCQVTGPVGDQTGLICDLSTTGVYVRLERLPPAGATVRVAFQLFPGDPRPLEVEAEVMWHNEPVAPRIPHLPPGCGLRFTQVSPEDAARIAGLVQAIS